MWTVYSDYCVLYVLRISVPIHGAHRHPLYIAHRGKSKRRCGSFLGGYKQHYQIATIEICLSWASVRGNCKLVRKRKILTNNHFEINNSIVEAFRRHPAPWQRRAQTPIEIRVCVRIDIWCASIRRLASNFVGFDSNDCFLLVPRDNGVLLIRVSVSMGLYDPISSHLMVAMPSMAFFYPKSYRYALYTRGISSVPTSPLPPSPPSPPMLFNSLDTHYDNYSIFINVCDFFTRRNWNLCCCLLEWTAI